MTETWYKDGEIKILYPSKQGTEWRLEYRGDQACPRGVHLDWLKNEGWVLLEPLFRQSNRESLIPHEKIDPRANVSELQDYSEYKGIPEFHESTQDHIHEFYMERDWCVCSICGHAIPEVE